MKHQSLYTNTGKPGAIVGLVLVTFLTSATILYTPQICEGIVKLAKMGKQKVDALVNGQKTVPIVEQEYHGYIYTDRKGKFWLGKK